MDHLWSPWRYTYVSQAQPSSGCIFCEKAAQDRDRENLIVHRAEHNYILMNLYPYTSGHVMIAPYAHVAALEDCATEVLEEMMRLAQLTEKRLRAAYRPRGLNIGLNIGECAGAGIAGHIHMHVMPRWPGDVNFMTTIGETRVIPEDLAATWEKLSRAFREG